MNKGLPAPFVHLLRGFILAWLIAVVPLGGITAAAPNVQQAGVVVDFGDGSTTWLWIPFEDDAPRLADLLHRTELDMVTIGFGGLGEGICQIDLTGCPPDECRRAMCQTSASSPFWRILKLNGDEWVFMSSGISGTTVSDGEVYALSWSAETPALPVMTVADIAQRTGASLDQTPLQPQLTTTGHEASSSSDTGWIPIAGTVGGVLLLSGVAIYRARRRTANVA